MRTMAELIFFADGTIYKAAYKYCRPNVGVEDQWSTVC